MLTVTSQGTYEQLHERFAAVTVGNSVCIANLCGLDDEPSRNGLDRDKMLSGMTVVQRIAHPSPFTCVWSENSAHLVVITKQFIYLYKCVAGGLTRYSRRVTKSRLCFSSPPCGMQCLQMEVGNREKS
jgi:hypothetical protein